VEVEEMVHNIFQVVMAVAVAAVMVQVVVMEDQEEVVELEALSIY